MESKNNNLKLFPRYRQLSRDFLFFYTINILFLTQIKHIDMSAVVLVDTFYALFVVLVQVPATLIIGKIGRRNGMILGNTFNALYLILVMMSDNLISLLFAELACAFGFSLKEIAEPAILNGSIELTREEKSKKFAKIQGRAISGYYVLAAMSLILSGFLFELNGYIPMILCLGIVIITLVMSTKFVEPLDDEEEQEEITINLKDAIKFVYNSKRCRCLILFSGVFYGIISVLATYEISLIETLKIDSKYIGIIFAILNIISAVASRKQNIFQNKFKNRTLTVLGVSLGVSCIVSALICVLKLPFAIVLGVVLLMFAIKYISVGLYNVLLIKYLSNFTNKEIDTKIFAINSFVVSVVSAIFGIFASRLIDNLSAEMSMLIFGIISLIAVVIVLIYMKNKVGLDPKQYSELELKYDTKV